MELTASKFITEKEFKRLIRVVSESNTKAAQVDLMLYQYLALTGLRIDAALSTRWENVHDEFIVIEAEYCKDGKANEVYIGKRLKGLIDAWRNDCTDKVSPYMFNSQKGRINRSSAHRRLKQWLVKAGLRDSIHLHSFRHSFAVNALNMGVSLAMVKQQMHHKNISTTSTYLGFTSENLEKLKEVM